MPLIFGEVLFDCFPDGREVLGGAPFNVAWNLQALGIPPLFVSRVGNDVQGQFIRDTMADWSMNLDFLQVDPVKPTGRVEISLADGEPSFAILPNQAYDNIAPVVLGAQYKPSFLYHGSLALRNDVSRTSLLTLKREYAGPVFVDVNLRMPWWNVDTVLPLLEDATWLKLNEKELQELLPGESALESSGKLLLERFNLDAVFLTLGSKGALAFTRDGQLQSIAPPAAVDVVDTVGAGDGFSSILLLGLMHNWPLPLILERAQEFASAVVGQRGAITPAREFYQSFSDKWDLP